MESSSKLGKFFAAWFVGMVCLPGLSLVIGLTFTSLIKITWFQGIAALFFFLGVYGFFPCLVLTGLLALVCGLQAQTVKSAMVTAALVNLGIVTFIAMYVGGVFF